MKEKNSSFQVSLKFEWLEGQVFVKKRGCEDEAVSHSVDSLVLEAHRPVALHIFAQLSHCTLGGRVS